MAASSTGKQLSPGYSLHKESTTEILVAESGNKDGKKQVFINPIQEFNRDISVLALRAWSELFAAEKQKVYDRKRSNKEERASKKRKLETETGDDGSKIDDHPQASANKPYKFTAFEGLSATGLRSIRYAKEIPLLKWVQANDLQAQAAANIRMNVDWNGLATAMVEEGEQIDESATAIETIDLKGKGRAPQQDEGRVRVSQGDCCSVLYAHREPKERFDAVDLDPYGTAAPFIDGSVQAVNDGGLLCVTCTDLAVLAGSNYPEKCYSNYGGAPVKAEYTHEAALRLLLHSLAQSAARYGRYIKPVLCLSIDYYVRVFVRVYTGPVQVKKLASQTALVYVCHQCQSHHLQKLGKFTDKTNQANGAVNTTYGFASGPPTSSACEHCNGNFLTSGPIWAGDLHDPDFIDQMLAILESGDANFGTAQRIKGMLTLARHELRLPFYFTPSKIASLFHCSAPSLNMVAGALHNAGYTISRSHACAGSIKTDAPMSFIFDVMRKWIEANPVKMSNIKEGSPARVLLEKPMSHAVDMTRSIQAERAMLADVKLVRYQQNPTDNWGPQAKAGRPAVQSKKRKNDGPRGNEEDKDTTSEAPLAE